MKIRELSISGAFEITPLQRTDERGVFFEWYRFDQLEQEVGHALDLRQANASVSDKGVLRGIHFADFPRGQAKYVTAMHGAVLDFVIDIRVGSPTFGQWDSVVLDTTERRAIYLAEGLGHAFIALTGGATVSYLVTDVYHPEKEHGINPLDSDIALLFPREVGKPVLSSKDLEAPSLAEARDLGILPAWATACDHYASLNRRKES